MFGDTFLKAVTIPEKCPQYRDGSAAELKPVPRLDSNLSPNGLDIIILF